MGDGAPKGLPLIVRFFYLTQSSPRRGESRQLTPSLGWRTLVLVNPAPGGVHALSFPKKVSIHLLPKEKKIFQIVYLI